MYMYICICMCMYVHVHATSTQLIEIFESQLYISVTQQIE